MSTHLNLAILDAHLKQKGYHLLGWHAGAKNTFIDRFDVYGGAEGHTVIVQVFRNHCGFEVYVPLTQDNNFAATLAAIP